MDGWIDGSMVSFLGNIFFYSYSVSMGIKSGVSSQPWFRPGSQRLTDCFAAPSVPAVLHGGPLEEQEPSGAGVGGSVLLPGRAQHLQRGTGPAELQEEPVGHRGGL